MTEEAATAINCDGGKKVLFLLAGYLIEGSNSGQADGRKSRQTPL